MSKERLEDLKTIRAQLDPASLMFIVMEKEIQKIESKEE